MIEKIIVNEEDMTALKQSEFFGEGHFFELRFFYGPVKIIGWNIQYEEKLDMLAVIFATLEKSEEEDKKSTWKETFRFYVDRKKNTYIPGYRIDGKKEDYVAAYIRTDNIFVKKEFDLKTHLSRWEVENMPCTEANLPTFRRMDCCGGHFPMMEFDHPAMGFGFPFEQANELSMEEALFGNSIKEIRRFFEPYYITESKMIWPLDNFSSFLDFLRVKEIRKTESDTQKRIDEVSDLKKLGMEDFSNNILFTQYEHRNKMAIMERLPNDSGCVLRMFCIYGRENKKDMSFTIETGRVYIFEDSCVYATRNNLSEWVEDDISKIERKNLFYKLIDFERDIVKGTALSYTYDLLNEIEPACKPVAIVSLATKPIFEQLYKIGYKNLVTFLFTIEYDSSMPIYDLEYMCGITDPTKSELYAKLGVNKFQFDTIFKSIKRKKDKGLRECYFAFPLRMLRFIINGVKYEEVKIGNHMGRHHFAGYLSISDMDEKTFLRLLSFANFLHEYNKKRSIGDYLDCIAILNVNCGLKAVLNMQDYLMQINSHQLRLYRDYLFMVEKLEMFDKYRYNVTDYDELTKLHDETVELYDQVKDAMNREKFLKRVDSWKVWEYEDKKYAVIAPTTPEEIADEGKNLHHCVGSYIDRVTQGRTNIMFIRKKSNLSKSYFTAEVSNEGVIVQIHGFSNKLLSKEPALIPFIKDWVKERNLNGEDVLQ